MKGRDPLPLIALEDSFLFPDRKCTENKKYGANHKSAILVQKKIEYSKTWILVPNGEIVWMPE